MMVSEREELKRMAKDVKARLGNETYTANFICMNCSFKGEIEIAKGKQVRGQSCPNCGCRPCDID